MKPRPLAVGIGGDPRAALRALTRLCDDAARGELESRFIEETDDEDVRAAGSAVNRLLDVVDAYLRESSAAISCASRGACHRRLLDGGLHGAFGEGARTIDGGRAAMQESSRRLDQATGQRKALAAELDSTVLHLCDQLTEAASAMGEVASGVVTFAQDAVGDATHATDTVAGLRASSQEIRQAVAMITTVASQTRMLALNATIEAARAGDAGRGFAVVASEVKGLADEAAGSSEAIVERVGAVQGAAAEAITALEEITRRISGMDQMVQGMALAIDGAAQGGPPGLLQLAEQLRGEVSRFVHQIGDD